VHSLGAALYAGARAIIVTKVAMDIALGICFLHVTGDQTVLHLQRLKSASCLLVAIKNVVAKTWPFGRASSGGSASIG
jgi:hypothetical protein